MKRCTSPNRRQPTQAEWDLLRSRLIALECVVMALLGDASPAQLAHARVLASHFSHRAGFAHHPLTSRALDQLDHLLDRASHLRSPPGDY